MNKNECDLRQAYLVSQRNCGIEVGDRVKVLRAAKHHEGGWGLRWNSGENRYIGCIGEVVDIRATDGLSVTFPSDSDRFNWMFPWFVLEKVTPTPSELYLEGQRESGIKVGDRVRILRIARDYEDGWENAWISPQMDGYVGQVGEVTQVGGTSGICVDKGDGGWRFPYFVLQKVPTYTFSVRDRCLYVDPPLDADEIDDPLGLSIEKWEFMEEAVESGIEIRNDRGGKTCALCVKSGSYRCQNCPIRGFTDRDSCYSTPYHLHKKDEPWTLAQIRAELYFLRALKEWRDG